MRDVTDTPGGRWVSLADAAAALLCSDRTIRRRVRDGSLQHRKDGPRLLVFLADDTTRDVDTGSPGGRLSDLATLTQLTARIDTLTAEVTHLRALVDNLTGERDYLRQALGNALALRQLAIEAQAQVVEPRRKG
jgi:hypothetical protein